MQEFDHIEAIWAAHQVDIRVSADEMLKQAKKEVGGIRRREMLNIMGMMGMTLLFFGLWALWLVFDFYSVLTHIGISIITLSIMVFTVILYNNHKIISKTDFTANPIEFLNNLKKYQLNHYALYRKLYWFYVFALSLGTAFSYWEILAGLNRWIQGAAIFFSFGWFVFCSTLLRKAIIKRNKERITLLIEKFNRISEQFNKH